MNTEISNTSSAEVFVETIEFTPFELAAHIKATENKVEPTYSELKNKSRLQDKATRLWGDINKSGIDPDVIYAQLARREVAKSGLSPSDLSSFYMSIHDVADNLGADRFSFGMALAHYRLNKEQPA